MLLGIHFPKLINITTVPSHMCMGIPETRHDSATFSIAYSNIRVSLQFNLVGNVSNAYDTLTYLY